MSVNSITNNQKNDVYTVDNSVKTTKKKSDNSVEKANCQGVVYEKLTETDKKRATYSINQMSANDRKAIVKQLEADQESRQQSLVSLVQQMMGKQGKAYAVASGNDSMWKFLASGNYTVDAATKEQAQKDIAEDGYWGVKQTSKRLFDFASALAGDDVDKMKEMQKAVEEGYKLAEKAWGGELPEISKNTYDATNKLFEEYYKSKEV